VSPSTEIVIMWATVTAYALSAVLFIVGFIFARPRLVPVAFGLGILGIVPHVAAIAGRWARVGHAPFLGFYEVISTYALVGVAAYALLVWRKPQLRPAGLVLMPIAFLGLGAAMMAPSSDMPMTAGLASYWLGIHVAFAKLSYGSFITGFGLAVVYLLRERSPRWERRLMRLPDQESIDQLGFRFSAAGLVFLGIMIVAGAIWANESWGRYWGWDPIETWSLVSWIVYAAIVHLRLTFGWRGRRFQWALVAGLPVLLFAMVGVVIIYESIHGAYLVIPK